jgi:signal transduction histidine kinase
VAATVAKLGHRAHAVMPLIANARVIGAIGASYDAPRTFSSADQTLAAVIAQHCAQALDRSRLLEAEREAREAAEAANRAKADFLAVMSHELRTPLNAIAGYTDLLTLGVRGPITEAQRADLERIKASQRHLLGLINEVLSFAKLESGETHFTIEDVAVHALVADAIALVEPQAGRKEIPVRTRSDPGESHLMVRADAEKVVRILVNLLSNAVKFSHRGEIVVACGVLDERVRISVTDNGTGIPKSDLHRIFEPFVQVRPALTRTSDGTGLGLAISRGLARAMRGDLTVTSVVGEGSTFVLDLPLATPDVKDAGALPPMTKNSPPM